MKKFLHCLAAALLVGLSFAATSCSDDPEESEPTPQFPTPLPQQTILPGESYSFTITPNMKWEVSIPEEARSWFYLDDNGTKVSKVRGAAVPEGGQPITIKVGAEDVEIYDAVDPVEVTMTMGAETKTIATLTVKHTERELKFYMAKIENDDYVYNEDMASTLQYSYEAEAKTDGSVQLKKYVTGAFYGARLLVESNVSWTISVPDWIEAHVNAEVATSGNAGQSEVELRVDYAKMSLEGVENQACSFNATAADGSAIELAKIAVSLENLTGLLECDGLPEEALFSARGNYLTTSTYGASISGFITAPKDVQIIAIGPDSWGDLVQCDWVTPEIDPWSGEDKIQTRNVSISVAPQKASWSASERQAFVYVLPATMKDVTADNVIAKREEYEKYLETTITQEASTFLLNAQNSLAMKENGVKFENDYQLFDSNFNQWNDWMKNDNSLYYKLTYTKEYSVDGGALDVGPMPDGGPTHYSSYKIYGYNAGSAGENLPADNKWIQLQENRNAVTNVVESFKVLMNFDQEYVNTYGDYSKKYAAIVFYDENNIAIATLECEYNENASTGGDTGSLTLGQYASYEGTTLEMLATSDPDYTKYAAAYADFSPSVYRVTFTTVAPTMSGISGLPNFAQYCEVIDGVEWLSRPEPSMEVTFAGLMNTQKSAKGAYIFYTGGSGFDEATQKVIDPQGPAVILVVNLVLEQQ